MPELELGSDGVPEREDELEGEGRLGMEEFDEEVEAEGMLGIDELDEELDGDGIDGLLGEEEDGDELGMLGMLELDEEDELVVSHPARPRHSALVVIRVARESLFILDILLPVEPWVARSSRELAWGKAPVDYRPSNTGGGQQAG